MLTPKNEIVLQTCGQLLCGWRRHRFDSAHHEAGQLVPFRVTRLAMGWPKMRGEVLAPSADEVVEELLLVRGYDRAAQADAGGNLVRSLSQASMSLTR